VAKKQSKVMQEVRKISREDAEKCAKEINDILIRYGCMIVPKTVIIYNKVSQVIDIVPNNINPETYSQPGG
jgi:hypothetical protein